VTLQITPFSDWQSHCPQAKAAAMCPAPSILCMHAINPHGKPSLLLPTHTDTPPGPHTVHQATPLAEPCSPCASSEARPLQCCHWCLLQGISLATALVLLLLSAKCNIASPCRPAASCAVSCTHAASAECFPSNTLCGIDRHLSPLAAGGGARSAAEIAAGMGTAAAAAAAAAGSSRQATG